jgi:ABC-type lipoprotein release transport system permease subunit
MVLRSFQETFSMGQAVHEIALISKDLKHVHSTAEAVRKQVESALPSLGLQVLTWQQLLPGLEQSIEVDMVSGWINYGILVIIVAFGIMNTFVMCVLERTREFGMLLALGMRRVHIVKLVLLESTFMSLLGVLFGIVGGSLLTYYFQIHGLQIPGAEEIMAQWGLPSRIWPKLTIVSIVTGPAVILLVTLLTAAVPVLRILRLRPAKALRAV